MNDIEYKKIFSEGLKNPSTILLIISNFIILFFYFLDKIGILEVIAIYTAQVIIVSFFGFIKIKIQKKKNIGETSLLIFFFMISIFVIVETMFSLVFPNIFSYSLNWNYILYGTLIFLVNHTFSFFYNIKEDCEKEVYFSIRRILPLFIVSWIFAVGSNYLIYGSLTDKILIIIFIVIKTYLDVDTHIWEHSETKLNDIIGYYSLKQEEFEKKYGKKFKR